MSNNTKTNPVLFFLKESWLLMVAAIVFGCLLACLNAAWGPKILENQQQKFNTQAGIMLADAETFENVAEDIMIDIGKGAPQEVDVKKALDANGNLVGWAFMAEGAGFADKIQLVLAVSTDFGTLAGYSVLSSNETPGFGDKIALPNGYYQKQFVGIPTRELILKKTGDPDVIDENIVAISGATVSSQAVVDILNTYVGKVKDALKEKNLI